MRKVFFIFMLTMLFRQIGQCQTKIIAQKSHSGSLSELNYLDQDNFGMAPQRRVRTAKLDTVIYINDSLSVMITSMFCTLKPVYMSSDTNQTLWKAGKDTVINHPLFSKQHDLDGIKKGLKQYHFVNPIDSIVFIGYDNKAQNKVKRKKRERKKLFFALFQNPFIGISLLAIIFFISFYFEHKSSKAY